MKDRHFFTLIELLVVIAIIAILAAMLMPALQQARMRGQSARCLSNLKQQGVAVALYEDANDGYFPIATASGKNGWLGLINGKYLTLKVIDCPADTTRTAPKDFKHWDWMPEEDRKGFNRSYVIDAYLGQTMGGVFQPAYKQGKMRSPSRLVAIFCSDPCHLNAQTDQPICWSNGHCNWENHINPESDGTAAGLGTHAGNRNILTMDGGSRAIRLTMDKSTNFAAFNWHGGSYPMASLGSWRYYQAYPYRY